MINLTLIVPVYNVENYIESCITSLKELGMRRDVEIIIINDGSTDSSIEIVKRNLREFHNFKIISQENQGLSSARNAGVKSASGKYVGFIDSDDYIDSKELFKILRILEVENVDIVVNDYLEFFDWNVNYKNLNSLNISPGNYDATSFYIMNYKELKSVVWRNIYNREFILKNEVFFHDGVYFEDVEFTPIVFSKAKDMIYTKITFYYYRRRMQSITTSCGSERKVMDALAVWETLNRTASQNENSYLSSIMRELGFHCFLHQYSLLEKRLPHNKLILAKSYNDKMATIKYKILSILFNYLPDNIFHRLLRISK